ncbi:hypothetical protein SAE01_38580 [Segetibacter aerophilus]|uniref:Uncharacterized protein n=1 Tax=Segetibacter aerophilus TaxID=670293 RepID=A0A512BHB8_9BACT|nr:hypothetical protein SAE01_38580 [Segetibacter aerophilus]
MLLDGANDERSAVIFFPNCLVQRAKNLWKTIKAFLNNSRTDPIPFVINVTIRPTKDRQSSRLVVIA